MKLNRIAQLCAIVLCIASLPGCWNKDKDKDSRRRDRDEDRGEMHKKGYHSERKMKEDGKKAPRHKKDSTDREYNSEK